MRAHPGYLSITDHHLYQTFILEKSEKQKALSKFHLIFIEVEVSLYLHLIGSSFFLVLMTIEIIISINQLLLLFSQEKTYFGFN